MSEIALPRRSILAGPTEIPVTRLVLLALLTFVLQSPRARGQAKGEEYEPIIPLNDNSYLLTADSKPQPNVPAGKAFDFYLKESKIFPGTPRKITVYVPAGKLDLREPFYALYVLETEDDSGAGQIAMDANGLAYVATRLGVQVLDRNGRVIAILPLPEGQAATGIKFGGASFDSLYVSTAGGRVYRRKRNVVGVPPFAPPVTLPKGSAG